MRISLAFFAVSWTKNKKWLAYLLTYLLGVLLYKRLVVVHGLNKSERVAI